MYYNNMSTSTHKTEKIIKFQTSFGKAEAVTQKKSIFRETAENFHLSLTCVLYISTSRLIQFKAT